MSSIIFNKYQSRSPNYHWQQVSRNLFIFNAFVVARYQQVIKLIPKKANQRLLDIGCGDGVLLNLIKRARLYGVDLDQSSLNYAATRVKAKFFHASAFKLPFKANFFDVVLATEIIEHLSRPQPMLQEIRRVLKPNGCAIISTPIKPVVGLTDKLHVREYTPEQLQSFLKIYFKKVKIYQSHPYWLKKMYTSSLLTLGRFHFDLFRWVINTVVFSTGYNPFLISGDHSTQQVAVGRK
ncbi:MAG: class I SAM-dependent methyltransferase [Candidatus Beckwithbacteria bacterium]|nr:class I SAM-dependent methyltransferase [Candidatus Beckwithbacteria bacterium]